jgi:hypothetical protein
MQGDGALTSILPLQALYNGPAIFVPVEFADSNEREEVLSVPLTILDHG